MAALKAEGGLLLDGGGSEAFTGDAAVHRTPTQYGRPALHTVGLGGVLRQVLAQACAGAASLAFVIQGVAREYHETLGKLEDKHAEWLCNHTLEGIPKSPALPLIWSGRARAGRLLLSQNRSSLDGARKEIEHNISAMASET